MGKIERLTLPDVDRARLEQLVRDRNTPQKVVWRARIVLLAGAGVGLYLNPPDKALVLSDDETGTLTHDKRHGTTTWFAALAEQIQVQPTHPLAMDGL